MPAYLIVALMLIGAPQHESLERAAAEQLARSGEPAAAMAMFARIVEQNPDDVQARLWVARLLLRLGRVADAEAAYRDVLRDHPDDIDAQIGVATVLTRRGQWRQALVVLLQAEPRAGDNAELFSAMARAYRRAGDDQRALAYFGRARALSPADSDIIEGLEGTARAFGHSLILEGFGQRGAGSHITSASLEAAIRAMPRLHIQTRTRLQTGANYSDAMAGGGVRWRLARATVAGVHGAAGPGNTALASADFSADVTQYLTTFETGGSVRMMSFSTADVIAISPTLAWDRGGRWRFDSRYSYSRSRFVSGESAGDHSVMIRDTLRPYRRVSFDATYAYGIESFEQLTAPRPGSLRMTTAAGGIRISLPSMTTVGATWEHQWRSNDTAVDRVTLSLSRFWP